MVTNMSECDIQKEVTKFLKDKEGTVKEAVSPFLDLLSHFYNIPDSTQKSISIVKDDTLKECVGSFSFSDKTNNCVKRFKSEDRIKKTYIIENNLNFVSVNKEKDKEPVVRAYSFKDIEKYLNKKLRIYFVDRYKRHGKGKFEVFYNKTRAKQEINLLVRQRLRHLGLYSDYSNSGYSFSYFKNKIESNLPVYLSNEKCYTEIKPGKILNRLFDRVEATDSEEVSSCIISFFSDIEKNIDKKFTIIKGEPIRYFYNERNYEARKGNLGNSCMRYPTLSPWKFDLYCKNPDKVSMLTYMNQDKTKIKGRAILWTTDKGEKVIDRVYYDTEFTFRQFVVYCKLHGIKTVYLSNTGIEYYGDDTRIPLDFIPSKVTPYLDSFGSRINKTKTIYRGNAGTNDTTDIPLSGNSRRRGLLDMIRRGHPLSKSTDIYSHNNPAYSVWSSICNERRYTFDEFFELYKEEKIAISNYDSLELKPKALIRCFDESIDSKTALNAFINYLQTDYYISSRDIYRYFSCIKVDDTKYIESLSRCDNTSKVKSNVLNAYIDANGALYNKKYNDFVPSYINTDKMYQMVFFIMKKLNGKSFRFKEDKDNKAWLTKMSMFPMYLLKDKDLATKVSTKIKEYFTRNNVENTSVSFSVKNEKLYMNMGSINKFVFGFNKLSPIYLQYAINKFLVSNEKIAQRWRAKESKKVSSSKGLAFGNEEGWTAYRNLTGSRFQQIVHDYIVQEFNGNRPY